MLMRLQKYRLKVQYYAGHKMDIADMPSQAYLTNHQAPAEKDFV